MLIRASGSPATLAAMTTPPPRRAARRRRAARAARRAAPPLAARERAALCAPCRRALPWLRGGAARAARCRAHRGAAAARRRPRRSRSAWAPLAYEGVARRLVAALKFRGALPVAGLMAAQIAAQPAGGPAGAGAALVPVAGRTRRAGGAGGFDPAGALAAALAARHGRAAAPLPARGATAARARSALGRAPRRATGRARRRGARARRRRACCWSTTSTPRARRSTPARARWRRLRRRDASRP